MYANTDHWMPYWMATRHNRTPFSIAPAVSAAKTWFSPSLEQPSHSPRRVADVFGAHGPRSLVTFHLSRSIGVRALPPALSLCGRAPNEPRLLMGFAWTRLSLPDSPHREQRHGPTRLAVPASSRVPLQTYVLEQSPTNGSRSSCQTLARGPNLGHSEVIFVRQDDIKSQLEMAPSILEFSYYPML